MVDNNIEGTIIIASELSTIDDESLLKQIGVSKDEALDMNPIIQFLYVKK